MSTPCSRRDALTALLLGGAACASRADEQAVLQALRAGGVVIAFRHALAPGTYDPPGFRLDDCGTQRNLDDEGRRQARAIGAWFKRHGVAPRAVRSSPWCRCVDTARLAFGRADVWPALAFPRGESVAANEDHVRQMRDALADAARARFFDAWVSHNFVLSALAGVSTTSGEGLVLRAARDKPVEVVARLIAF